MTHRLFVCLGVLLLSSTPLISQSATEELEQLVQDEKPPTYSDLAELLPDLPKKWKLQDLDLPVIRGNLPAHLYYNYPFWRDFLKNGGPHMIAQFEAGFPGATWVFIGRDVSVFADLFESYYEHIGQPQRVIRLNASRATIDGVEDKDLLNYLKQEGISTHYDPQSHPTVFVDSVSSGGGGQGRRFLDVINRFNVSLGVSPSLLPRRYNFIGLHAYATKIKMPPVAQAQNLLTEDETRYREAGQDILEQTQYHRVFGFFDPLGNSTVENYEQFTEASYVHWVGHFHESYGELERVDGVYVAPAGELYDEEIRRAYLRYRVAAIKLGRSKGFIRSVERELNKLGILNPKKRPSVPEASSLDPIMAIFDGVDDIPSLIQALQKRPTRTKKASSDLERREAILNGLFFEMAYGFLNELMEDESIDLISASEILSAFDHSEDHADEVSEMEDQFAPQAVDLEELKAVWSDLVDFAEERNRADIVRGRVEIALTQDISAAYDDRSWVFTETKTYLSDSSASSLVSEGLRRAGSPAEAFESVQEFADYGDDFPHSMKLGDLNTRAMNRAIELAGDSSDAITELESLARAHNVLPQFRIYFVEQKISLTTTLAELNQLVSPYIEGIYHGDEFRLRIESSDRARRIKDLYESQHERLSLGIDAGQDKSSASLRSRARYAMTNSGLGRHCIRALRSLKQRKKSKEVR